MNVAELRELLDQYDDDAPVRVAYQPSWPLRGHVVGVVAHADLADDPDEAADVDDADVVWVAVEQVGGSAGENPYAPRDVWGAV